MNLLEFEGKALLRKGGVPVPHGVVAASPEEVASMVRRLPGDVVVLKAQVPAGHRGQAGGILFAPKAHAVDASLRLFGHLFGGFACREVLLEERVEARREWYASALVDRDRRRVLGMFSEEGGMDIEALAASRPERVRRFAPEELRALDWPRKPELVPIFSSLFALLVDHDALLLEINPLLVTPNGLVAADAKAVLDDNALFRHPELATHHSPELTPIEAKAHDFGLPYVELDGTIGVIGCGAGLVMSSLDLLEHFGARGASFLDIGGGASTEIMEQALDVTLMNPRVRGLFINIFGGLTRCEEIAAGIVDFRDRRQVRLPIVVRMIGTHQDEGRALLLKAGILGVDSTEEGAQKIVEMVR